MLLLLSACALITKDDYDARVGVASDDTAGADAIAVSGTLDVLNDRVSRSTLAEVEVGILRYEFNFGADQGEPFVFMKDMLTSTTLTDAGIGTSRPFQLELPALPPEEHHYDIEGLTATTYMLVAFVDTNGNGEPETEDILVGANVQDLLVYIVDGSNAEIDEEPGWYLIAVPSFEGGGITDVYPVDEDFFVWNLESTLLPGKQALEPLAGKVEAERPDGTSFVTLWNLEFIEELFEGKATERTPTFGACEVGGDGRFELSPLGIPERALLSTIGVDGADYSTVGLSTAIFVGLAWQDDGDGELEYRKDERPYAYSTASGKDSIALIWYEPIGFESAFMSEFGVEPGWSVMGVIGDEEGKILPWTEVHLVLGDEGI